MKKLLILTILITGFSSLLTQLTLLREFFSIFSGNELSFGLIVGNWLLLTGIGSYLGRFADRIKDKILLLGLLQIVPGLLLLGAVFIARISKSLQVFPGEVVGLKEIFLISLLLLLPFCLVWGFNLVLVSTILSSKEKDKTQVIGKVYILDTIADVSGALLFSFLLNQFLTSFQIAYLVSGLNLATSLLLLVSKGRRWLGLIPGLILISMVITVISLDLEGISNRIQYPNQEILYQKFSLYGNLVVTRTEGQLNFFENGIPLFNTGDPQTREETIHYAMIQHPDPASVLILSGGISGTLEEILKYKPDRIDYVEIDPLVIKLGERFLPESGLNDNRVHVKALDARLFVKQTEDRYDVIIVDLPDPENTQINRLYTLEFFYEVKRILKKGGIFSLSLSSQENYMSLATKRLNASIFKTLKEVFLNVLIIPAGGQNFFVASEEKLTYDISERIEEKGIKTRYVNRYYLAGSLTQDRIAYVNEAVREKVSINRDFAPITYYYYLLFWMSRFDFNPSVLLPILGTVFLLAFIMLRPIPLAIFSSGISGISLEIILVISFQVLYGYVYHKLGLLAGAFMTGIAIGAWTMKKKVGDRGTKTLSGLLVLMALFCLLLPVVLSGISRLDLGEIGVQILFPLLTIIAGCLVGLDFPLAAKLHFKDRVDKTAGTLYAADLIGSFLGALVSSSLLIPLLGVFNLCFVLTGLNLVCAFLVMV